KHIWRSAQGALAAALLTKADYRQNNRRSPARDADSVAEIRRCALKLESRSDHPECSAGDDARDIVYLLRPVTTGFEVRPDRVKLRVLVIDFRNYAVDIQRRAHDYLGYLLPQRQALETHCGAADTPVAFG